MQLCHCDSSLFLICLKLIFLFIQQILDYNHYKVFHKFQIYRLAFVNELIVYEISQVCPYSKMQIILKFSLKILLKPLIINNKYFSKFLVIKVLIQLRIGAKPLLWALTCINLTSLSIASLFKRKVQFFFIQNVNICHLVLTVIVI